MKTQTQPAALAGKLVVLVGAADILTDKVGAELMREGAQVLQVGSGDAVEPAQAVIVFTDAPSDARLPALDVEAEVVLPLESAWLVAKAAVSALRAGGGGALTLLLPGARGDGNLAAASLGGGLQLLARALAAECGTGPAPVRINALASDLGSAAEVAELAVFLSGDGASFVTGQTILKSVRR